MNILLTGGTGYIGSHTALALIEKGHTVMLYDNLSNSSPAVIEQMEAISNCKLNFIKGDVRDTALLKQVLLDCNIEGVMHFAGLKAVGESVEKPLDYFSNNVYGTISLLAAMKDVEVHKLVFSSSATIYGEPQYLPLDELHPTAAVNPYGRTKLHIEEILKDLSQSANHWRIACLRYFNPVGAHPSGLIGENPRGIPNNLMPYIARVAERSLPQLNVYGADYPTSDGTAIRDYIHITDLAEGHIAALDYLGNQKGWHAFNLGTGQGQTVLEMVKAFEKAIGRELPHKITNRRSGDIAICYAKTDKAFKELGWKAQYGIDEMCLSAWSFQTYKHSKDDAA